MHKLFFIFIFLISTGYSQVFQSENFGVKIGLQVQVGTHIDRIGLILQGYYTDYFYQINAGSSIQYSFKGYGGTRNFWSSRTNAGAILLAGKRQTIPQFNLDGLNHNTAYNLGLGYNYLWYRNNAGTSQNSGGWSAHVKEFSLYLENDIFAGQGRDRFRTGNLILMYHQENFAIKYGVEMWTGETRSAKIIKDAKIDCRGGYKKLDALPFGKTSSGNMFIGIDALFPYGNVAYFSVGLDSENVRDFFQNKIVHNSPFAKDTKGEHLPIYPMLDSNGFAVFNSQNKRKDKPYLQIGYNGFISY